MGKSKKSKSDELKTPGMLDPRDFENMEDKDILSQVVKDFNTSNTWLTDKLVKWARYYRQYRSHITAAEKRENGANLYIPYTFSIVESAVPKLVMALTNSRPFLKYKPVSDDDIGKAEKMTNLVDFQMHNRMKMISILCQVIKTAVIFGTGISKQTWKIEAKNVVRKKQVEGVDEATGQPTMETQEVLTEEIKYDAPFVQNIPLEDFFVSPYAINVQDSPYAIHRYWMPLHKMKKLQEQGVLRDVDKISGTSSGEGTSKESLIGNSEKPNRDEIEILEYWTDDWKVMVANKSVVVQSIMSPYYHRKKPFTKWVDTEVPGEFYGIGIPETCESLQAELNTTRNQRIDNVSYVLNRMFKILRGANVDPNQLISRANGFIEVDSMEDIDELRVTDVTSSAYNEEQIIKGDMNDVTGVHNQDRGAPSTRRETATTATLLANGSDERIKLKITQMEDSSLADMGMQIAELNKQFIDTELEIRILGDGTDESETTVVSPEDLEVDLDLVAVGSATEPVANKEIRQNQLIQLLNVASNQVASQYINMPALLTEIFKEFDMKDVDKYVVIPPPPIPQDEAMPPDMMSGMGDQQPQMTPEMAMQLQAQLGGGMYE